MYRADTQLFLPNMPRNEHVSHKKIILAIIAVIVLLATVGITLFSIEKMFSSRYEQAASLMASNDFLKAEEQFLDLSGYRDSADKAQECRNRYDYDVAKALLDAGDYVQARVIFDALGNFGDAVERMYECDYAVALALMDMGKLQEAKDAFLAIGGFSDSKEKAVLCQKEIDYIAAVHLFDSQDYTNALDAFKSLSTYKDSPGKAQECMDYLYSADYTAATTLLTKKDYANALTAFRSLGFYKDSADKAQECQNNLDYIAAGKAYKDKKYYTAYIAFSLLGTFSDSAERAAKCIQKNPKSGQVYRNSRYKASTSPVTITAPKSGYSTCLKIYDDKTLVCTVFIADGKQATISLPAGTYIFKKATGTKWFGAIETFGTDVSFKTIVSSAKVRANIIYKLEL